MIKPLLEYQEIEREKLKLISTVEDGKAKRDLDEATRVIDNAKRTLLSLESEAKNTLSLYESASKNLSELFAKVAEFENKTEAKSEDEIQSALTYLSSLATKIHGYESQLKEMQRKIDDKHKRFEETKIQVVKAQKVQQALSGQYKTQSEEIQERIVTFEKELKAKEKLVDPKILERYKKKRASLSGKYQDVAVEMSSNRCGGCHFELPLSMTHKVATDGYIVCEECGKIIYKA